MTVHIETISADRTLVEVLLPQAEIPGLCGPDEEEDPFDQPTLILTDQDNALVIVGTKQQLAEVLTRALAGVAKLPS